MLDDLFKTLQRQAKPQTRYYLFYNKIVLKKRLITLFIRHYPKLFFAALLITTLLIFAFIHILKLVF